MQGAERAGGRTCRGRTCRGPNVQGATLQGSNVQRVEMLVPSASSSIAAAFCSRLVELREPIKNLK